VLDRRLLIFLACSWKSAWSRRSKLPRNPGELVQNVAEIEVQSVDDSIELPDGKRPLVAQDLGEILPLHPNALRERIEAPALLLVEPDPEYVRNAHATHDGNLAPDALLDKACTEWVRPKA
jgi:hypothetical protein